MAFTGTEGWEDLINSKDPLRKMHGQFLQIYEKLEASETERKKLQQELNHQKEVMADWLKDSGKLSVRNTAIDECLTILNNLDAIALGWLDIGVRHQIQQLKWK